MKTNAGSSTERYCKRLWVPVFVYVIKITKGIIILLLLLLLLLTLRRKKYEAQRVGLATVVVIVTVTVDDVTRLTLRQFVAQLVDTVVLHMSEKQNPSDILKVKLLCKLVNHI